MDCTTLRCATVTVLGLGLAFSAGCGHTARSSGSESVAARPPDPIRVAEPQPAPVPASKPEPEPARAEAAEPSAVTKPAPPPPAPAPRPRIEPGPPPAAESIASVMSEHFLITSWARDVVVSGQLEPLRAVLTALADHRYESIRPGAWEPWIMKLQAAARVAANAPNLRVAAKAVTAMGRVCGECHQASGAGPKFAPEGMEVFLPYPETFPERMGRHMWAAEQLWLGLTGPSDASWKAGATALRDAPLEMDEWLPPAFATELDHVREVGEAAGRATQQTERADVYARVLATCAGCHKRWMEHGL